MKRNGKACLDAFAWLAWLQDEPGAAAVQRWLDEADAQRDPEIEPLEGEEILKVEWLPRRAAT